MAINKSLKPLLVNKMLNIIIMRQNNNEIKKLLKKSFPNYKFSVRQDTGTACMWTIIKVTTDKKNLSIIEEIEVNELIEREVINHFEISTWNTYTHDGFDTTRSCLKILVACNIV